ncbi:hypothetical protein PLICRDRAFT_172108 [Plicaturopsis crispa FD-325 SS-3]|nr:hypothetical protein PLICRDRAFT_172108 [Plicaturopsis crispa FD-325 SS-3]
MPPRVRPPSSRCRSWCRAVLFPAALPVVHPVPTAPVTTSRPAVALLPVVARSRRPPSAGVAFPEWPSSLTTRPSASKRPRTTAAPSTPLHTDVTQRTHQHRPRLPAHNNNAPAPSRLRWHPALATPATSRRRTTFDAQQRDVAPRCDDGQCAPSGAIAISSGSAAQGQGQHTSAEETASVRQLDDGAPTSALVQPDPRLYRVHQPRHTAVPCGVATAHPHPRRLALSDGRARQHEHAPARCRRAASPHHVAPPLAALFHGGSGCRRGAEQDTGCAAAVGRPRRAPARPTALHGE